MRNVLDACRYINWLQLQLSNFNLRLSSPCVAGTEGSKDLDYSKASRRRDKKNQFYRRKHFLNKKRHIRVFLHEALNPLKRMLGLIKLIKLNFPNFLRFLGPFWPAWTQPTASIESGSDVSKKGAAPSNIFPFRIQSNATKSHPYDLVTPPSRN